MAIVYAQHMQFSKETRENGPEDLAARGSGPGRWTWPMSTPAVRLLRDSQNECSQCIESGSRKDMCTHRELIDVKRRWGAGEWPLLTASLTAEN